MQSMPAWADQLIQLEIRGKRLKSETSSSQRKDLSLDGRTGANTGLT
jgi:hypothetical protein